MLCDWSCHKNMRNDMSVFSITSFSNPRYVYVRDKDADAIMSISTYH